VGLGNANDDAAFTAALSKQFALTANKTRQFYFTYGGGAYLGKLWNAGNNYGVLVATSYAEPNVGYRFKQMVRVCTNGTWGAWVDNSPTAFAPSGYGYGDNKKYITASTEAELESVLDERLARMIAAGNTYGSEQLTVNSSLLGVYNGTGILHCTHNSGNYAFFVYYGFYPGGSKAQLITKVKYDGKWKPIDKPIPSMKLLWTNASPTSSFAAQTVSLALTDYEFVMIESELGSTFCKVGNSTVMFSHNTYYPCRRTVSVTTSGVTFGEGLKYTSCPGDSVASDKNAVCIPRIIYGVKGIG
jgi:hypothetical protein